MNTTLIWLSQDLRLHDNAAFHLAIERQQPLICLFCIDTKWFKKNHYGVCSLGTVRWQFLQETLHDLHKSLKAFGQKLFVATGNPLAIIEQVIDKYDVNTVIHSEQYGYNEFQQWLKLRDILRDKPREIHCLSPSTFTLFHPKNLPEYLEFPCTFSKFRKKVDSLTLTITNGTPKYLPAPPDVDLKQYRHKTKQVSVCSFSGFNGGETWALKHLNQYFQTSAASNYRNTRNDLDGWDYSCKFSPWLANGSLSVRQVLAQLKAYELHGGANESTEWIYFELLWREYFQWYAKNAGQRLFTFKGIRQKQPLTSFYPQRFKQWSQGKTPWPLVNACMNQLNTTGYLSNRGRQIVASCLVNELSLDWRCGAYFFEQQLIDYDPAVNWGNWQYIAGVGSDPRGGRHFDLVKQAKVYDPDGAYLHRWARSQARKNVDSVDMVDWPVES